MSDEGAEEVLGVEEVLDDDDDEGDDEAMAVEAVVDDEDEDDQPDEDESALDDNQAEEDDDEEEDLDEIRSNITEEDANSAMSPKADETPTTKRSPRKSVDSSAKKGRTPSVAGLTIPFRTVKKAMKLDPDTPIVQNEAAIMTTIAAELFLKSLAKESFGNAKSRGRNTIRYEDVAEARTKDAALAFLETLLP